MRTPLRFAAFALLLWSASTAAQISFGGRPLGLMPQAPWLPEPPVAVMPTVDADALIAEDEARYALGVKGPYRFGFNHATDLGTGNTGVWHTLRNGDRVWRLAIECPGAFSINFRFDEYVVPEGARVFVYNAEGSKLGAFTAESNPGHTTLGVSQLPGDRIVIEYHETASVAGQGRLHIDRVTHGYRDIFAYAKDLGSSGPCNINVICPEGDNWRDQIRSVAIITTGGSGFCTGTLLNNCEQDSTPYFLTANHCLGADVADWVFRFNWDSPVCDPTENGPIDQTVSGCELLVSNPGSDMAFLRLNSIPPAEYNVFWSGWDHSDLTPDSVAGIHHPAGDIKKISLSASPFQQTNIDVGNGPADCWQVTVWDAGTTEPGSSGSGLWNQNKMLIGQLYGGQADCSNSVNDYYGRFATSWPFLEEWLGATCGDTLGGWDLNVEPPIAFDAAVTSIGNIPEFLCGIDSIWPAITLKNNGTEVLTAVTITYGVLGGPSYIYDWTGSLQPDQTVNVSLPGIPIGSWGTTSITVACSAPNGNQDQVITNDTWTWGFTANNPSTAVTLLLTLDNFGSDVTWTLENDSSVVLGEGGPYADLQAGMVDTVTFCLTNGCYTFTINDQFGDGICCAEGDGGYVILDVDSVVLAESDGQYTFQNIDEFCLAAVGIAENDGAADLVIFPNPTNGLLNIRLTGADGILRTMVYDGLGRAVIMNGRPVDPSNAVLDLGGLGAGIYTLVVDHGAGRSVKRVVVQR
ncbi:MAG: T9SS type A sorting domain-containing protein [Flavobacteriales bacterium]